MVAATSILSTPVAEEKTEDAGAGQGAQALLEAAEHLLAGIPVAGHQIALNLSNQDVGVRIGLNAGEPIERDGDLFGTAVQPGFGEPPGPGVLGWAEPRIVELADGGAQ